VKSYNTSTAKLPANISASKCPFTLPR